MAAAQPQPQEGVIDPFPNEGGEGFLRVGREGRLSYSGDMVQGKAEGRGTIRCKGGRIEWTIRGAEFRGGAMLPCRAVIAHEDDGDAFFGPLTASGNVADNARGAYVRGEDGGRFEGTWPANGKRNWYHTPRCGVAWVADGSVYAVKWRKDTPIGSGWAGPYCWVPGGAGWVREGVLTRPDGQVRAPDPRPTRPWSAERTADAAGSRRSRGATRCGRRRSTSPSLSSRTGGSSRAPAAACARCAASSPTLTAAAGASRTAATRGSRRTCSP
jgi:hypothetical protein